MDTAESDINNLESDLASEESRAMAAESDLDARLDVLEAKAFAKQKITISTELSYVELTREATANSLVVAVGRLMVHKDEDYTVSVVGGKTRLTWIGAFASNGAEAIESGDVVFITYAY
jgi:hypothetical protein